MSEVRTQPVKATLVSDVDECNIPGAFEYYEGTKGDGRIHGMVYICPCGCGRTGVLDFRRSDRAEFHPSWEWNGNKETPTLAPSVHHIGHWHGWLRNGVWESV